MKVVLANSATTKLADIYAYLVKQAGENIASRHIEEIETAILARLDTFPKIGEVYKDELIRKITIKVGKSSHYSVLYEIDEAHDIISVYQIYGKGEDW